MAGSDDEATTADTVGDVAEGEGLLVGEVGDLAALLGVAGVAIEDDAGDPLLDGVVEALDGGGHDGGALAVAGGDDDGVRALLGSEVEEALRLAVGAGGGALGQGVGADGGVVGATDALAGDLVVAVLLLQARAGGRANGLTLEMELEEVQNLM